MARVRDSQRSKVYKFDNAARLELGDYRGELSFDECFLLINKVLDDYGEEMVMVTDGRGRSAACANERQIKMPKWSRCRQVVLHEVAHVLTRRYAARQNLKVTGHGPMFVGILARLLTQYTELTHDWILAKLKELRIDIEMHRFIYPEEASDTRQAA